MSLVDVPGHERFIRTMVAGATGIDAYLMVIAATEGVREQTVEHARILEALKITAGIVVITKTDLAAPGRPRPRPASCCRARPWWCARRARRPRDARWPRPGCDGGTAPGPGHET